MKARGKREAKRSASPLGDKNKSGPALTARNTRDIRPFRPYLMVYRTRGDVEKLCLKTQHFTWINVSTTCGSGWVDDEQAILLWILNSGD
jgi:hypothetical protein